MTIFQLLTGQAPDEIESHFANQGYAQLKQELAEITIAFLRPLRERGESISDHELGAILDQAKHKAQGIAQVTLETVMARLGISGAKELLVRN